MFNIHAVRPNQNIYIDSFHAHRMQCICILKSQQRAHWKGAPEKQRVCVCLCVCSEITVMVISARRTSLSMGLCVHSFQMIINCIRPFNQAISISSIGALSPIHPNLNNYMREHISAAMVEMERKYLQPRMFHVFRLILIRIIENNLINTVTKWFLRSGIRELSTKLFPNRWTRVSELRTKRYAFETVVSTPIFFRLEFFLLGLRSSSVKVCTTIHICTCIQFELWNYYLRLVWINLAPVETGMHIEFSIRNIGNSVAGNSSRSQGFGLLMFYAVTKHTML